MGVGDKAVVLIVDDEPGVLSTIGDGAGAVWLQNPKEPYWAERLI